MKLICGYSQRNRGNKFILALNGYVDDSLAQVGKENYCLAGYMSTAQEWMRFSDAWDEALHESPKIGFFKASEAESLKGEFLDWTIAERDEKVMSLAKVVESHSIASFDCNMSKREFEKILLPFCPYDLRDPYYYLFYGVMASAARQLYSFGIDIPIDFIFDEQGRIGIEASLFYGSIRAMQPVHLQKLLGNHPIFRKDIDLLPLQAADCLVWHLRRSKEERFKHECRPALDILLKDKHTSLGISKRELRNWAAEFKKIVPPQDRLRKGASIVQDMKRLENHVAAMNGTTSTRSSTPIWIACAIS